MGERLHNHRECWKQSAYYCDEKWWERQGGIGSNERRKAEARGTVPSPSLEA